MKADQLNSLNNLYMCGEGISEIADWSNGMDITGSN